MIERIATLRSVAALIVCSFLFACSVSNKVWQTAPLGGMGRASISAGWQLQDAAKVPETGREISQTGYSPSGWCKATVPGTVLTSLVNDGVYPEPLYGENNRPDKIPESLCRTFVLVSHAICGPSRMYAPGTGFG